MSRRAKVELIERYLSDLWQLELDRRVDDLLQQPKYQDPKRLNRYEHKVFSQSGEDGVLAEIFRRIGVSNRVFAEVAAGDGLENNTHYFLTLGWKGFWMECDAKRAKSIRSNFQAKLQDKSLTVSEDRATPENVESMLARASLPADFDLLSIDIDGNDYWLWQKIQRYRPRVVVIEYNSTFPAECDWVMEYNPEAGFDGTVCFGASLLALERLGVEKGYNLVGCSLAGTNAFFVREELLNDGFAAPFTAQNHYEPPRYYLASRRAGHNRVVSPGRIGPPL